MQAKYHCNSHTFKLVAGSFGQQDHQHELISVSLVTEKNINMRL